MRALLVVVALHGIAVAQPQMAKHYKDAADLWRRAAQSCPAKRACCLIWADYYDKIVLSLRSGGPAAPPEPTCKPPPCDGDAGGGLGVGTGAATAENPVIDG